MKKVVYLMGLPCTGKSTIINEWALKGGTTLPEFLEPVPNFVHNSSWQDNQAVRIKRKNGR